MLKACKSLPAYIKEIGTITQFKKTLRLFLIKDRDQPFHSNHIYKDNDIFKQIGLKKLLLFIYSICSFMYKENRLEKEKHLPLLL